MKLQDYKCLICKERFTAEWYDSDDLPLLTCPECNQLGGLRKVYSFQTTRPVEINPAVTGNPEVDSARKLKEHFKQASDEVSERTGLLHDFQPVDLRDREALGVTDEGLEPTYKRLHEEGRLPRRFIST